MYLDFTDAIGRLGAETVAARYDNLFAMYQKITDENPYKVPMRIYPAVHYVMGGLWVDYHLMSNIPGLFVLGEANFSDHGANRLGASALMQGLADGYFVGPYTVGNYIASEKQTVIRDDHEIVRSTLAGVKAGNDKLKAIAGRTPAETFHKRLGKIMWDKCGMARTDAGLKQAATEIAALKKDFWSDLLLPGDSSTLNSELEHAGRLADFIELGELMCRDALERKESCGGHFREEAQTAEGEAKRDDSNFCHVAAWEYQGDGKPALRHQEELKFENVKLAERNYK